MFSLLLEPRSLLILKEDMYKVYLHGIKETLKDEINLDIIRNQACIGDTKYRNSNTVVERSTRLSLTIRYVSKVAKLNPASIFLNKKKS
jgi:alkylated DNA repair protein alkB family protein 6